MAELPQVRIAILGGGMSGLDYSERCVASYGLEARLRSPTRPRRAQLRATDLV